jgi:hypothetical protein
MRWKYIFQDCHLLLILHRTTSIPRPTDNKRKRTLFYSGKKKIHTVKMQFMTSNHVGIIIHKSNHNQGRRHDYDIYKENHLLTPKQVVNVFDLGYLGIEKDIQINYYPHYRTERREVWYCYKKK